LRFGVVGVVLRVKYCAAKGLDCSGRCCLGVVGVVWFFRINGRKVCFADK